MKNKYPALAFVLLLSLIGSSLRAQSRNPCNCTVPVITSQPQSTSVLCVQNSQALFSIVAVSTNNLQYQWQLDSVNISDDSIFTGCNSSTLTITNPPASLNGKAFRCVVKNCLGIPVASNPASISFNISPTDINADGVTNNADFAMLLRVYDGSCTACDEDITQDGVVNILDFLQLIARFNVPCN